MQRPKVRARPAEPLADAVARDEQWRQRQRDILETCRRAKAAVAGGERSSEAR